MSRKPTKTAVAGTPPTRQDQFWLASVQSMTPDKSLERIETHGKYLFSTCAVFTTLLSGFGLLQPTSLLALSPLFLAATFVLICVSLALAIWAVTPRVDRVNLNDVNSIRKHFVNQIRYRGAILKWAVVCFASGLLVLGLAVVFVHGRAPGVSPTSLKLSPTTGSNVSVSGSFQFFNVIPGARVQVEALGILGEATGPTLIRAYSTADSSGKALVSLDGSMIHPAFPILRLAAGLGNDSERDPKINRVLSQSDYTVPPPASDGRTENKSESPPNKSNPRPEGPAHPML